jgi:hypothetical protein
VTIGVGAATVGGVLLWFAIPDAEKARDPKLGKLLFLSAVTFLWFVAACMDRLYRWVWPDRVTLAQLVEEARPRSRAVVATAVRIYFVRHQLRRMGLWLVLTVPIAAPLFNAYVLDVGLFDPNVSGGTILARLGIACAIVTPVQLALFAMYAVHRCRQLARVARDGELVPAQVTSAQLDSSQFRVGPQCVRIVLTVTGADSPLYAFKLPPHFHGCDALWAFERREGRAVVSGRDRFAIVLSPEGHHYFAHRVRGWREVVRGIRPRWASPQLGSPSAMTERNDRARDHSL